MRTMLTLMDESAKQLTIYFKGQNKNIVELELKDTLMSTGKICNLFQLFDLKIASTKVGNLFQLIVNETISLREEKDKLKYEEYLYLPEAVKAATQKCEIGKTSKNVKFLTNEDITAQAIIFFIDGFETTSSLMCFAGHELAVNPHIHKKGEPTLKIKVGDLCWLPIFGEQWDPNYYPNPETFDPERFSEENKDKTRSGTYLPFGIGPRNCIGSRFALLETKILFFYLLLDFDIVTIDKIEDPLKLRKDGVFVLPENSFHVGLKRTQRDD
ncbi:p450 domain containing protein [Asbolus verrucosus]|uniref:p450 domain containing protein n=1 Tax=Asbolus verrucosus TaxID=1661398 RepID=A0A482W3A9_ASBVE|nr:p450 domain containing protein [Asbolus verrucosus]